MIRKSINLLLFTSALLSFSLTSKAGPRVGNGGGVWLCLSAETLDPVWMQLTDLFEAQSIDKLTFDKHADINFVDDFNLRRDFVSRSIPQLDDLVKRFAPSTYSDLERAMVFTSSAGELTVVNDGLYQVHPTAKSCKNGFIYFEQLADYTDDGRILINSTLWSSPAISDFDRSGLLMHEIIYKALREAFGDQNSVRSRRIVGVLFSNLSDEIKTERVTKILASPAPQGEEAKVEIYHNRVACQAKMAKTDGSKSHVPITRLLNRSKNQLSVEIGSVLFSVETDSGNGKPISMRLEDKIGGSVAEFDSKLLSETFLLSRRASLKLSLHKSKAQATLTCWEESYQ